jgi:hypothetical protein
MKPSLLAGPVCKEKLPECRLKLLTEVNELSPVLTQGGKLPVSKSPLTTMQGFTVAVGVGDGVGRRDAPNYPELSSRFNTLTF